MRALCLLVLSSVALGQAVPQPADAARPEKHETKVTAPRVGDDEPVGAYGQPGWTTRRRFPTTRVYVAPAESAQFEWWLDSKVPFDGGPARLRSLFELEFGLGHRLQLDLYVRTEQKGDGPWAVESERVELRYALADWGVLPGNPTLYLEWVRGESGVHAIEVKGLFGGGFAPRWHWGANAVLEHELGGPEGVNEYALTGAVAYSAREGLSLGAELKLEATDHRYARGSFDSVEIELGPSLQYRPVPSAHVDVVALFGVEWEGGAATVIAQPLVVFGWSF